MLVKGQAVSGELWVNEEGKRKRAGTCHSRGFRVSEFAHAHADIPQFPILNTKPYEYALETRVRMDEECAPAGWPICGRRAARSEDLPRCVRRTELSTVFS